MNISTEKFFEIMTESFAWFQILVSPLIVSILIGSFIYFPNPNLTTLILGISIVILGLAVGIIWANKAWKGKGTIALVSKDLATPEIYKLDKNSKPD